MSIRPLLLIPLLLLTGCSVLPDTRPVPAPARTFRLVLEQPPTLPASVDGPVLQVSHIDAQPGADTPAIVYRREAALLSPYTRSVWADAPARLLHPLVVARLEASGAFRAVLGGSQAALSDLRLDLELVELLHDFTVSPSELRLQLRALLVDQRSQQVVASRRFTTSEPTTRGDAQGGVAAANRAVARLLDELTEWGVANTR